MKIGTLTISSCRAIKSRSAVLMSLAALIVMAASAVYAQEEELARIRREKIEDILRIQDSRTIFDSKLRRYLSDPDPTVREQATLACASLQDTTALSALIRNLEDERYDIQLAAAFAIGQTATMLSTEARQKLESDLLSVRIPRTKASSRVIEELGKFGTIYGLNDLMSRIGNFYPPEHQHALTMSIARFGIRGITSDDAVRYLLRYTQPRESTRWEVMYALQRIGKHQLIEQEISHLAAFHTHPDPLVRMNLATLLGKLENRDKAIETLEKLASFDPDWRVRVNALKSLSQYPLHDLPYYQSTLRRTLTDGNDLVRLTAIESFGNTGLRESDGDAVVESYSLLRRVSLNQDDEYKWQFQAASALALAKLEGLAALPFLPLPDYGQETVQARILEAWGETGAIAVLDTLLSFCDPGRPRLHRAALDGLARLSTLSRAPEAIEKTYRSALEALLLRDVAVITTAASLLGDSLFRREASTSPLIKALSSMRIPDDVEGMQEIIHTLGKIGDPRAIDALKAQMSQPDRSVTLAAAHSLNAITGKDWSGSLPRWIQPLYADRDFKYLHSLPDSIPAKIETQRGDINIMLYKKAAPITVMAILKLATQRGYYRGLKFHRVVPNFVIQGGDPRGDGWGGPGFSLRSEFSTLSYQTGTIGIASAGKDTEGSQFFITQSPQPHLDGRYTIIGRVVSGMSAVDNILVDDRIYDFAPRSSSR